MKWLLYLLVPLVPLGLSAQMKINANSKVTAKGVLSTNTSITNASTTTDFTNVEIFLEGGNQQATTGQPLVVSTLSVNKGGTKTITGNWEVTNAIALTDGIIKIGSGAKLLYSGSAALQGRDISYVDGFLHINNTLANSRLTFPVGVNAAYTPVVVEDAPVGEIGFATIAGDAGLSLPADISSFYSGWYWQSTEPVNSAVSLSLNGVETFLGSGAPYVLESDATGGTATSLGGSVSASFVLSSDPSSKTILAIGKGAEFSVVIHDMITPYTLDNVNDKLTIENIELTESNNVKLVDRWGLVVKEWTDFTNDVEYDFSQLSPGNYVCVVEYSYPGSSTRATTKGVVTILKSN